MDENGNSRSNLQHVFEEFRRLLAERLERGLKMNEDTIRYTFYFALTTTGGLNHTDLTMEYPHPHPSWAGKEVDTVIHASADQESAAFEFKYDRGKESNARINRTQRAGSMLQDIFRLANVPIEVASNRYLLYVTDSHMAHYFRNPQNRLEKLFDMAGGTVFPLDPDSFQDFSSSLTARIREPSHCIVKRVYSADLPNRHCTRIFQVLEAQSKNLHSIAFSFVPLRFNADIGGAMGASYNVQLQGDELTHTEFESGYQNPKIIKIKPRAEQWLAFRQTLDKLDCWQWHREYPDTGTTDGTSWSLEIEYPDRVIATGGCNNYPNKDGEPNDDSETTEDFDRFLAAVRKLCGGKKFC